MKKVKVKTINEKYVGMSMVKEPLMTLEVNGEVIPLLNDDYGFIVSAALSHLGYEIEYEFVDKIGDRSVGPVDFDTYYEDR